MMTGIVTVKWNCPKLWERTKKINSSHCFLEVFPVHMSVSCSIEVIKFLCVCVCVCVIFSLCVYLCACFSLCMWYIIACACTYIHFFHCMYEFSIPFLTLPDVYIHLWPPIPFVFWPDIFLFTRRNIETQDKLRGYWRSGQKCKKA